MKKILYFLLVSILPLTSCSKDEDDSGYVYPIVSETEMEFGVHAGSQNIAVGNKGKSWTIENNTADWLTFEDLSGKGRDTIRLSATVNNSTMQRTGSFKVTSGGETVTVNVVQRPDVDISDKFECEKFRDYCFKNFDQDKDGKLMASEVSEVTVLNVNNMYFTSLKGIEYFFSLANLNCSGNQIEKLNLNRNPNLTILDCSRNSMGSLAVTDNTKLTNISAGDNFFTAMNVRNSSNLVYLDLSNNREMTVVDVSYNRQLYTLDCSGCSKLALVYIWEGCNPGSRGFTVPDHANYSIR